MKPRTNPPKTGTPPDLPEDEQLVAKLDGLTDRSRRRALIRLLWERNYPRVLTYVRSRIEASGGFLGAAEEREIIRRVARRVRHTLKPSTRGFHLRPGATFRTYLASQVDVVVDLALITKAQDPTGDHATLGRCLGALLLCHEASMVRQLRRKLARFGLRHLCVNDLEDILGDIRFKVLRGLPAFRPKASFAAWYGRIIHNHVLDLKKRWKKRRCETWPLGDEIRYLPDEGASRGLDRVDDWDQYEGLVQGLSPWEREAVRLWSEYGHRDASERLGITARRSRRHLHRILRTLSERGNHVGLVGDDEARLPGSMYRESPGPS